MAQLYRDFMIAQITGDNGEGMVHKKSASPAIIGIIYSYTLLRVVVTLLLFICRCFPNSSQVVSAENNTGRENSNY